MHPILSSFLGASYLFSVSFLLPYRSFQSPCSPCGMSLRELYGAACWPASMAALITCAVFQKTSSVCLCSAAAEPGISLLWFNPGSSRPSTAALAHWRSATPACSGWWLYGLTATQSLPSKTCKWFGLCLLRLRWRSLTQWMAGTPGSYGAAWRRIHRRRVMERRRTVST